MAPLKVNSAGNHAYIPHSHLRPTYIHILVETHIILLIVTMI